VRARLALVVLLAVLDAAAQPAPIHKCVRIVTARGERVANADTATSDVRAPLQARPVTIVAIEPPAERE
jgi:hypothetical protein